MASTPRALELWLQSRFGEECGKFRMARIRLGQTTDEVIVVEPEAVGTRTVQLRQLPPEQLIECGPRPAAFDPFEHEILAANGKHGWDPNRIWNAQPIETARFSLEHAVRRMDIGLDEDLPSIGEFETVGRIDVTARH